MPLLELRQLRRLVPTLALVDRYLRHIGARLGKAAVGTLERARLLLLLRLKLARPGFGTLETRAAFALFALRTKTPAIAAIVLSQRRPGDQRDRAEQTDNKRLTHHVLQTRVDPNCRRR